MAKNASPGEADYSIGTVAGLTGLDPHTLRAWERRYGAVRPNRSPRGRRRYDAASVARLQLLKALTDCGESIGTVATLPEDALRERLVHLADMSTGGVVVPGGQASSVALLGPTLSSQMAAEAAALGRLRVVGFADELAPFLDQLPDAAPDVVVAELRCLGQEPLRWLEEIQNGRELMLMLVVYDFARAGELARLNSSGARTVRGPLRLAQLQQTIDDFLAIEASAAPRRRLQLDPVATPGAPHLFAEAQLARLIEWRSAVQCECPNHVAALVSSAQGFERYAQECEERSPEDAALHRYLAVASARVRHELETMLERVCEHEGIRI